MSSVDSVHREGPVTLAIRDYGGTGRPFVLVHGAGANLLSWELLAPLLVRHGRVIAFDQRGHGFSEGPVDYALSTLASDMALVVGALRLQDPIVLGHSWGAAVAVEYAATHVCAGVVNVDGNVGSPRRVFADTEVTDPQLEGASPPDRRWSEDDLASMAKAQVALRSTEGIRQVGEIEVAVVGRNMRRDADGSALLRPSRAEDRLRRIAVWEHDLSSRYRQLKCPVLFVMNDETRLGNANARAPRASAAVLQELELLLETLRRCSVRWVPGGHNIPLTNPRELAGAVVELARSVA